MNRTIIINKMYTGKYLETGENIGHEIINLFKADNDRHYIYLNSQGTIGAKYVNGARREFEKEPSINQPNPNRIIDVLLARPINSHVLQILALAKDVTVLDSAIKPNTNYNDKDGNDDMQSRRNAQKFSYDGIEITDILMNNVYKDHEAQDIFATFVTKQLYKPKKPLFLCSFATEKGENEETIKQFQLIDGDYKTILTKNGFGIQSLRLYFTGNDETRNNEDAFNSLLDIINEPIWTDEHDFGKVDTTIFNFNSTQTNFLSIIKEEDRELTFSNLLQHFLSDKLILKGFCEEVLKINIDVKNADISINREEHNVDLIIRDGKNIIVIENKILSGINGENKTYTEQLSKIFSGKQDNNKEATNNQEFEKSETTQKILKNLRQELESEAETKIQNTQTDCKPIVSQLSKYYFYARKIAEEEGIDKENIKFYIICPQYQAKFYSTENLKQYLYGEKYTTKTYKDLLDFFEKHCTPENFYLNEFVDAMRKHAKERNNSKEDEMKTRFIKAIKKAKK